MKLFSSFLLSACWVSCLGADDRIYLAADSTEELIAKEGQIVVVYGETENSAKVSSGTNFVNFKRADFSLVTFKSDLDQFQDGEPHELYDGKRIAVEGLVSIYRDKPQIKLTSPKQVAILEPDDEFPPKAVEMKPPETVAEAKPAKEKKPEEKSEPEPEKRKPPVDASEFFK